MRLTDTGASYSSARDCVLRARIINIIYRVCAGRNMNEPIRNCRASRVRETERPSFPQEVTHAYSFLCCKSRRSIRISLSSSLLWLLEILRIVWFVFIQEKNFAQVEKFTCDSLHTVMGYLFSGYVHVIESLSVWIRLFLKLPPCGKYHFRDIPDTQRCACRRRRGRQVSCATR